MQNEEGYFVVPYDAELECKQNIVVYDSNTSTLREPEGRHFMHTLLFFRLKILISFKNTSVYNIQLKIHGLLYMSISHYINQCLSEFVCGA